jgi:general secretion pathway protein D
MRKNAFLPVVLCLALVLLLAGQAPGEPQKKAKTPKRISIEFVDVELASLAKFVSDTTGVNLIFDDRLKGKVTIMIPGGLSDKDLLNLFSSVLELKSFTMVPAGNAYKILPTAEVRQEPLPIAGQINENYTIQLIPLEYVSPEDAVRLLTPLVSKDGYIAPFPQGNYLFIVDTSLNIEKITDILDIIDARPQIEDIDVVKLTNASADDVARLINEGFAQAPGEKARAAKAIPDLRLNALILIGSPADKERMKRMIELLDVPGTEVQGGINVYFLEHANAEDLSKTLQTLITGGRLPQQQAQRAVLPGAQSTTAPQPQTATAGTEKISITPDKATNALVIMASQADYQVLLNIIQKLDRPRRQVFVEAMIVEASLDNLRDMGTKWRASAQKDGKPVVIGGIGTIDTSAMLNIVEGLSGFSAGGLANFMDVPVTRFDSQGNPIESTLTVPGFAALFSLSDFRNAVNILSTPQILTSDNQEAEIVVGQNVPFITASSLAAAGTYTTNTIERKDVGIKLRITPHVTEGDLVRLDIYQEISAVVPTPANTNATQILTQVGPTTTLRSTKTTVTVNNDSTIVIGGLISETVTDSVNKMPVLGDIPILGYLFKNKSLQKQKTNLLVFISPKIIKTAEDIQRISLEKEAAFKETKQGYVTGNLIVKFKEGVPDEEAQSTIAVNKAEVIKKLKDRLYLVKIKDGRSVPQAAEDFSKLPQVQYAEPNYVLKIEEK